MEKEKAKVQARESAVQEKSTLDGLFEMVDMAAPTAAGTETPAGKL